MIPSGKNIEDIFNFVKENHNLCELPEEEERGEEGEGEEIFES